MELSIAKGANTTKVRITLDLSQLVGSIFRLRHVDNTEL